MVTIEWMQIANAKQFLWITKKNTVETDDVIDAM